MSFRDPLWSFNAANPNYVPGNMGRNVLYGPGYWRLNPALYKNFKVTERINAEFRAEATNVTNSPIWNNPNAGSGSLRLTRAGQFGHVGDEPHRQLHVDHGRVDGPGIPLWPARGVLILEQTQARRAHGPAGPDVVTCRSTL
jgi:hypothetical protein